MSTVQSNANAAASVWLVVSSKRAAAGGLPYSTTPTNAMLATLAELFNYYDTHFHDDFDPLCEQATHKFAAAAATQQFLDAVQDDPPDGSVSARVVSWRKVAAQFNASIHCGSVLAVASFIVGQSDMLATLPACAAVPQPHVPADAAADVKVDAIVPWLNMRMAAFYTEVYQAERRVAQHISNLVGEIQAEATLAQLQKQHSALTKQIAATRLRLSNAAGADSHNDKVADVRRQQKRLLSTFDPGETNTNVALSPVKQQRLNNAAAAYLQAKFGDTFRPVNLHATCFNPAAISNDAEALQLLQAEASKHSDAGQSNKPTLGKESTTYHINSKYRQDPLSAK